MPSAAGGYFGKVSTNTRWFSRSWIAQKIWNQNWIFLEYFFCDTAMSPLYIPSCPPGQHLLSAVGCGAGKCKIRPADERLTIISIHNSTKICQIFPDRNIPHSRSMANLHHIRVYILTGRWRSIIYFKSDQMFRLEFDCASCRIDIETIGRSFFIGPQGEPTQYVHPQVENALIQRNWILIYQCFVLSWFFQ